MLFEKREIPGALQLKDEVQALTETEKLDKVNGATEAVWRFMLFCQRLVQHKEDHAHDGQYRVIFGDLHADTVKADVMIKLEMALPK